MEALIFFFPVLITTEVFTGMGSNEVPQAPHDFGTVSGAKLLFEPNIYNGNFNWRNYSSQVPRLKVTVIVT